MADGSDTTRPLYDESFREIVEEGLRDVGSLAKRDESREGSSNSAHHFRREVLQALRDKKTPFNGPRDTGAFCSLVDTSFRSHFGGKESTRFVRQISDIIAGCRKRISEIGVVKDDDSDDGDESYSDFESFRAGVLTEWTKFGEYLQTFISDAHAKEKPAIAKLGDDLSMIIDGYKGDIESASDTGAIASKIKDIWELINSEFENLCTEIDKEDVDGIRSVVSILGKIKSLVGDIEPTVSSSVGVVIDKYVALNPAVSIEDEDGDDLEDSGSGIKIDKIVNANETPRIKAKFRKAVDPLPAKDFPHFHVFVRFLTNSLMNAVTEIVEYIYRGHDLPLNGEINDILSGAKAVYVTTIQDLLVDQVSKVAGKFRNPSRADSLDEKAMLRELFDKGDLLHVITLIFSAITGVKSYPPNGGRGRVPNIRDNFREIGEDYIQNIVKACCVDRYFPEVPKEGTVKTFKWREVYGSVSDAIKAIEALPVKYPEDDEGDVDLDGDGGDGIVVQDDLSPVPVEFTADDIEFIEIACEDFFREKPGYQTDSLVEFVQRVTRELNVAMHGGSDVHKVKDVSPQVEKILGELKSQATVAATTSPQDVSPLSEVASPKVHFIETLPEIERQMILDNQQWIREVLALHSRDSKLNFEKRLIYAIWHYYSPENIVHLSLSYVRFFTKAINSLRKFGKIKPVPKKPDENFLSLEDLRIENLIPIIQEFMEADHGGVLSVDPNVNALNDVLMSKIQSIEVMNRRIAEITAEMGSLQERVELEEQWNRETDEMSRVVAGILASVQAMGTSMPDVMSDAFDEWRKAVDRSKKDLARKQSELQERKESHVGLDIVEVERKRTELSDENEKLIEDIKKVSDTVKLIQGTVRDLLHEVVTTG